MQKCRFQTYKNSESSVTLNLKRSITKITQPSISIISLAGVNGLITYREISVSSYIYNIDTYKGITDVVKRLRLYLEVNPIDPGVVDQILHSKVFIR
jgi:hypothetical protein